VEVKKLYETAELPSFETTRLDDSTMEMIYRSSRHFEDLAEGLILGCFKHFGEKCSIRRNEPDATGGICFTIDKIHA